MLIIVICVNWYNSKNANTNTNTNTNVKNTNVKNPQAIAAAAIYNKNRGMNVNMAANAESIIPAVSGICPPFYNKTKSGYYCIPAF